MQMLIESDCFGHFQKVQVKDAHAAPADHPLHDFKPVDCVVVSDLPRKNWEIQTVERPIPGASNDTHSGDSAKRETWVHASCCRCIPLARVDEVKSLCSTKHQVGEENLTSALLLQW